MLERIKLDPLVNRRVVFKLRGQESTMDTIVRGYDDHGWWVEGGTLAEFMADGGLYPIKNNFRYLEARMVEWFQAIANS